METPAAAGGHFNGGGRVLRNYGPAQGAQLVLTPHSRSRVVAKRADKGQDR